jgi:ribosome-binding factor A
VSGRKARVGDAIRDTLAEMIAREVKDPRVTAAGVVSITSVEMNVDLSVATVRVSVYGGDDKVADKALEGLKAAAGYLRGPLARKLRLARPPELRFTRDTGLAFALEISRIVREDEERAKAARPPEPEPVPEPDEDLPGDD